MKWFAIALFILLCWRCSIAPAAIDNPLKHGSAVQHAEQAAIPGKRCPELSNPIECHHAGHQSALAEIGERLLPKENSCDWLRVEYRYHHPFHKPATLSAYTGCALYRADHAYHTVSAHLGLNDDTQEQIEKLLSNINLIPELTGA